jgi:hypothetical protein
MVRQVFLSDDQNLGGLIESRRPAMNSKYEAAQDEGSAGCGNANAGRYRWINVPIDHSAQAKKQQHGRQVGIPCSEFA